MNCAPISLVHAHAEHGNRLTLTKARKLCKTTRNGTFTANLTHALTELGYVKVRTRERLTWHELKRLVDAGNDVFVAWWSPLNDGVPSAPDGHWSLARKVDSTTVTIYDPDPQVEITLPRLFFEANWFSWERKRAGGVTTRHDYIRSAVVARWRPKSTPK